MTPRTKDLDALTGSLMARDLLRDLAGRVPAGQAYTLGLLSGLEGTGNESVLAEYRSALAAAATDKVRDWTR